jgi:hypothetical protein
MNLLKTLTAAAALTLTLASPALSVNDPPRTSVEIDMYQLALTTLYRQNCYLTVVTWGGYPGPLLKWQVHWDIIESAMQHRIKMRDGHRLYAEWNNELLSRNFNPEGFCRHYFRLVQSVVLDMIKETPNYPPYPTSPFRGERIPIARSGTWIADRWTGDNGHPLCVLSSDINSRDAAMHIKYEQGLPLLLHFGSHLWNHRQLPKEFTIKIQIDNGSPTTLNVRRIRTNVISAGPIGSEWNVNMLPHRNEFDVTGLARTLMLEANKLQVQFPEEVGEQQPWIFDLRGLRDLTSNFLNCARTLRS